MKQKLVALLYFLTFAPAALDKLSQSEAPAWFLQQFSPTLLGIFPSLLPVQYFALGVAEGVTAVLMLAALFVGPKSRVFQTALEVSFLVFVALGFGQRISHKFDGAAELFFYAGFTFLIYQSFFKSPAKVEV